MAAMAKTSWADLGERDRRPGDGDAGKRSIAREQLMESV